MGKFIDHTGKTFGRWFVVGRAKDHVQPNGKPIRMWACMCSCKGENSIKAVSGANLVAGLSTSCGCYKKEVLSKVHSIDLKEKTFGRWFVVKSVADRVTSKGQRSRMWLCECECKGKNSVKVVRGSNLVSGQTTSCGCLQKEKVYEAIYGVNNPNWKEGVTPLQASVRNNAKYKEWRKEVFERDNYTCRVSDKVGRGNLRAHHIKPFAKLLEENKIVSLEDALNCKELWDVSNGITLLKKYHSQASKNPNAFHKLYGTRATEEDFHIWFAEMKNKFARGAL